MEDFAICKGSVYTYRPAGGGGGKGFYAMQPELKGTESSPVLINGCASTDTDVVAPVLTLAEKKILYAFSQDFGRISVTGNILLGSASSGAGQGLNSVIEYFKSHRVTASGSPVSISMPGNKAYKMYLTGLDLQEADPKFHILGFALLGLIVEPP